jgi:type II secretory pathway component GspD/PulD (secretin)
MVGKIKVFFCVFFTLLVLFINPIVYAELIDINFVSTANEVVLILSFSKSPTVGYYGKNENRTVHYFVVNDLLKSAGYIPVSTGSVEGVQLVPLEGKVNIFVYTITPVNATYNVLGSKLYIRFPYSMSTKRLTADFLNIESTTLLKDIADFFGLKIVLYDSAKDKKINLKTDKSSVEDVLRSILVTMSLSYAYSSDQTIYIGSSEEIKKNFAAFWQVYDDKLNVEKLREILKTGSYAGFTKDKSKIFVYGGVNEYRMIAEALMLPQKEDWYYIPYTISDKDIEELMPKIAKIYGLDSGKYEIFKDQKKVAVKTSTPWEIEVFLKQLASQIQQRKWYYIQYNMNEKDLTTLITSLQKIYNITDFTILQNIKKVAVLVDSQAVASQIENIIESSSVKDILHVPVEVNYPERVQMVIKELYPGSDPKVIGGKLYVASGYEQKALELAKEPYVANPWQIIVDDVSEDVVNSAFKYLGLSENNYNVKTVNDRVIVTLFASESTYKKFLQFIDLFGESTYVTKADDKFLKNYKVTVLQRFSDGTKLVSGRIKEIERLKKAVTEELTTFAVQILPSDPSAELISKLTGYTVESKDGYFIVTVSKSEVENATKIIEQIRKSYGSSVIVLNDKYKQEAKKAVEDIYGVKIYQVGENIIIQGVLAEKAKQFLDNIAEKAENVIEPLGQMEQDFAKMIEELFNVKVYQAGSTSYMVGTSSNVARAKDYAASINTMTYDVNFEITPSHIEYIKKVYDVEVQYFSDIGKITITGLKNNVERAKNYLSTFTASDKVISIAIPSNVKKEDVERISKLMGFKLTFEQIGDMLYIRGNQEDVEKIKSEIDKFASNPNRGYIIVDYPDDIDNIVKQVYNVETHKISQGYIVFGTSEKLKQVSEFLTNVYGNGRTFAVVLYPDEFDNAIRELFGVKTYKLPHGYVIAGTKEVIDKVTDFIKNFIPEKEDKIISIDTQLDKEDISTIVSAFDPTVKYFKVNQRIYLVGSESSIGKIKDEILSFKPDSEYNLIDGKLLIEVKDKDIKELILSVSKILSQQVVVIDDIKSTCSMRLLVQDFRTFMDNLKQYNVTYEIKDSVYYVSLVSTSTNVSATSTTRQVQAQSKVEPVSVSDSHITISVTDTSVDDVITQVMLKLGKSYRLEKIDKKINSMYLKDIDYETFKRVFSLWADFTEVDSVTYITPKTTTSVDSKKVYVKDGLISVKVENEQLSNIITNVFSDLGYQLVFAKPIDKTATMSISGVDFDTFTSIMLNYGISIKRSGQVYLVDTTPEATKVRTTYMFNVPRNADKVEELIKFYGGKTMISPSAGIIVAYDLDPKNVDDINQLISRFTTAKIVSIEAKIIDESNNSGLSQEIVTMFKSGNYITFSSNGLSLNLSILDILDGSIIDKILNEAGISVDVRGAEAGTPLRTNVGLSKLLANPNIMTKSGEEARIFIGDSVPVKITSTSGGQTSTQITNLEGGIELKIVPYVNADNTIDLVLTTSVSNFDYSVVIDGLPKINKREASTKITIKDGQTLVIGGLSREEKSKSEWKVPILGDLPIIGILFKGTKETSEQRNITIFLTAKILEVSN